MESVVHDISIRDYLVVLRRRLWIMLAAIIVVPACVYILVSREAPTYDATATVATKEGDIAATVAGIQDNSYYADPTRIANTQIALAETPRVAAQVLKRAGITNLTPDALLGSTLITANSDADLLYFTVSGTDPTEAVTLANAYAAQYTVVRSQLDTQPYLEAEANVQKRIAELDASGQRAYANTLVPEAQRLQTYAELETSNAILADTAQFAAQTGPRTKRDTLFGFALGALLGIGLAFLREALDTRIRGPEDVAQRTGLLLLARVPQPPRSLQADELIMFKDPASVEAEAFRVLRTNLDFASIDHNPRSMMITSAVEKEGKSTTIANLAIVQARAGRRVVLVDLDLRRPRLDRLFQLPSDRPGLTNVILGHATLEQATAHVPIGADSNADQAASGNGNGYHHAPIEGMLDVIPSGPIPPDPGEFVSTSALSRVLDALTQRYDMVLIDAPPLLRVGDALTLATRVDALIVVTRLPELRRPVLNELRRVLDTLPTRSLGFVMTGQSRRDGYASTSGYYYEYKERRPNVKETAERR